MDADSKKYLGKCFANADFTSAEINSVYTDAAKIRATENSFKIHFDSHWSEAFEASEFFYVLIKRIATEYISKSDALPNVVKKDKYSTFTALAQLYKRASEQYLEIMTLVKNGFPDGAFARWRSMYELSVISSFILKYGEDTAESFIASSASQDRYDWAMASGVFPENKRHVTFGDILKRCDLDTEVWKEDYTVANQTLHASPQGTFGRLGDNSGAIRSDYGIAAPSVHSANTLALIASMLFSVYPDEEIVKIMTKAEKWLYELIEIYCDVHEKLFGDEL